MSDRQSPQEVQADASNSQTSQVWLLSSSHLLFQGSADELSSLAKGPVHLRQSAGGSFSPPDVLESDYQVSLLLQIKLDILSLLSWKPVQMFNTGPRTTEDFQQATTSEPVLVPPASASRSLNNNNHKATGVREVDTDAPLGWRQDTRPRREKKLVRTGRTEPAGVDWFSVQSVVDLSHHVFAPQSRCCLAERSKWKQNKHGCKLNAWNLNYSPFPHAWCQFVSSLGRRTWAAHQGARPVQTSDLI